MAGGKIRVGAEITGDASSLKKAASEAAKAVAQIEREARQRAREIERNFKVVTIAMAKVTAAIIAVKVGFEAYGKVMNTTNATGDKFDILQTKIKFTLNELGKSLATADFAGFGNRMREAAKAGEELAKQLDFIQDYTNQINLSESESGLAMKQLELVFRNKTLAWGTRKKALDDYLEASNKLEDQQLSLAEAEVKAALAASSVVRSGLSEERLKYYTKNADLLNANEEAIKAYIKAQEDLTKGTISQRGTFIPFLNPEQIITAKNQIASASDIIKDFATDYSDWSLIIDPERLRLTEAWIKLNKILTETTQRALKPLRYAADLLGGNVKEMEKIKKLNDDLFTKVNMPGSFAEWGKAQQKNYGMLRGAPVADINKLTSAMSFQMEVVNDLQGAFEKMFMSVGDGVKGMVDSMIDSIKRLAAEIAAKTAVLLLLRVLFPETIGVNATKELMDMFGTKLFTRGIGAGNISAPIGASSAGGNINLSGKFKLEGRDAYLIVNRYANMLGENT